MSQLRIRIAKLRGENPAGTPLIYIRNIQPGKSKKKSLAAGKFSEKTSGFWVRVA
jgi:hypothetical protein